MTSGGVMSDVQSWTPMWGPQSIGRAQAVHDDWANAGIRSHKGAGWRKRWHSIFAISADTIRGEY